MLIGNDIVDLKDIDSYPPSENERFLSRVFTDAEQEYIKNSANPKRTLWMCWAVKESAYKAWKRAYPRIVFSPVSLKIDFEKRKILHHHYGRLHYKTEEKAGDFVAVYVYKPRTEKTAKIYHWIGEVSKLAKDHSYNSSIAARILVAEKLSSIYSVSPESIEVTKSLPPEVINKKDGWKSPVSLSHHGRYVSAFVMIPT